MRSTRIIETKVLGYVIERLETYDRSGNLESCDYEIRCPHTGNHIGRHANLRMAKRAVILHELGDVIGSQRRQQEDRSEPASRAA